VLFVDVKGRSSPNFESGPDELTGPRRKGQETHSAVRCREAARGSRTCRSFKIIQDLAELLSRGSRRTLSRIRRGNGRRRESSSGEKLLSSTTGVGACSTLTNVDGRRRGLSVEQLRSVACLTVVRVLDLDPRGRCHIGSVRRRCPFRQDALEVTGASELKKIASSRFDVVGKPNGQQVPIGSIYARTPVMVRRDRRAHEPGRRFTVAPLPLGCLRQPPLGVLRMPPGRYLRLHTGEVRHDLDANYPREPSLARRGRSRPGHDDQPMDRR